MKTCCGRCKYFVPDFYGLDEYCQLRKVPRLGRDEPCEDFRGDWVFGLFHKMGLTKSRSGQRKLHRKADGELEGGAGMNIEQRKHLEEIKTINGAHPFSAVGYEWLISMLEEEMIRAEAAEAERDKLIEERDKMAERVRVLGEVLDWLTHVVCGCGKGGGSPEPGEFEAVVDAARAALSESSTKMEEEK